MKELLNTLTTAANLKLLVGSDLGYDFPLKYPKTDDFKKLRIRKPSTLNEIIKATDYAIKSSFDERFDKKHPIELAVQQINDKGFTSAIIYKILHNKASVKSKQIKGTYLYLANFLSTTHRAEIIAKLKEIDVDKHGNFRRKGIVF